MFFRTIVAALGVIFLVLLAILLWPRSHGDPAAPAVSDLPPPAPAPIPAPPRPPPPKPAPQMVAVAPATPDAGRPQDQMEQVESCAGKPCGTPCLYRCDPGKDYGECTRTGHRSGQCNAENECTIHLPPVCP
jgi:hypothetical protein